MKFYQTLALAKKPVFCNCLVAMRPKTTQKDLPSRHNVEVYIHNKFVDCLKMLKSDILVSNALFIVQSFWTHLHL